MCDLTMPVFAKFGNKINFMYTTGGVTDVLVGDAANAHFLCL